MIQKNNPLLLKNDTKRIVESCILDKTTLKKIEFFPHSSGLVMLVKNVIRTIENGFTILEVKSEEFDSNISRKTIENLTIANILMPFQSFCIKFKDSEGIESTIFIDNNENNVIFSREIGDGSLSCEIKKNDRNIKDSLNNYTQESVDMILDSISIIMYFTAFSSDKKRASVTKVQNKNHATKKIAKNISVIKLNGIIYQNERTTLENHRDGNNKAWIVKGHWRKQPIGTKNELAHKTIWIDCFWKGNHKEIMNKIYKIN